MAIHKIPNWAVRVFLLTVIPTLIILILSSCGIKSESDVVYDIKQLGNVRAAFVYSQNKYKHIAEIQVICLDKVQSINIKSVLLRDSVYVNPTTHIIKNFPSIRYSISDTTNNLYEKIHHGLKVAVYQDIPDYYLSERCVIKLNDACSKSSNCMNGELSRADCSEICNVYDLRTKANEGYPNPDLMDPGTVVDKQGVKIPRLYGIGSRGL